MSGMDRRAFLTLGAAGALGLTRGGASAQDRPVPDIPYGETRLGLSDDGRDGALYVPKKYTRGVPMPVAMMLHGLAGSGQAGRYAALAEEFGIIIISPESRGLTWGNEIPGYDDDVRYLGAAYRYVRSILDVDRSHVALGGVSDGASYALSMGLCYGNTFNHIMVFSAGLMVPFEKDGKPRIFLAHGVKDPQMPIDLTARKFVPKLKAEGYDVTYREYDGGHGAPAAVVREGFEWFVADLKPRQP
jgi:phospholipase/carboxylesterase